MTKKEAKTTGKTFADHATHLVVHGVLHLAGYDHERPKDAKAMEPLEVKILKRLGIADRGIREGILRSLMAAGGLGERTQTKGMGL